MPRWLRLPALSGAWVRALVAPALVCLALAADRNYLADFWHHLARGRAIVTEGQLLDADRFTYTVYGRPFRDPNWLSQSAYYVLYRTGGMDLVRSVNALALAAMMGVVVGHCRRRSGSWGVAGLLGVATFFGLWQILTVRPQSFSLLLFAVLYLTLDAAWQRRWLLLLPPPILALWANVHGGFPIGLVLIVGFALGALAEAWPAHGWRALRDGHLLALAGCLAASALATLLNPYGWKLYEYVATTSAVAADRRIDEWLPPGPDLLIGKAWLVSLALLLVAFASRARPRPRDVCLVLCFLPLACGSVRMVMWWLLVLAPILAEALAVNLPAVWAAPDKPSRTNTVFAGLLMLAVVLCLPGLSTYHPLLHRTRQAGPRTEEQLQEVASRLEQLTPAGRVFCRFEWGEYLGWALAPRWTVFMDGRIEIFPDAVWREYSAVTGGRGHWETVLDKYGVDCLVLDAAYHQGTGLLPLVEGSGQWQEVGRQGPAVLFVRRQSGD